MDTTQNLSPSLIIFVFFSLVLCVWAIVEIFRSKFTKMNKAIWLLVVLFAPFGVFIYLFIGRRFRPSPEVPLTENTPQGALPAKEAAAGLSHETTARWPGPLLLFAMAVFCVLLYLKAVMLLGQENTAFLLLGAMVVVGAILTVFYISQARKKR